jgi:hypothetical protein
MKRYVAFATVLALMCCVLCACGFWDGEYVSVEPHQQQSSGSQKKTITVANYHQMRDAVVDLIESGAESGILYIPNFSRGSVRFYMETAIRYATETTPIGAYAVENISYEIGTRSGKEAIALSISYRRELSEILRIEEADEIESACRIINGEMEKYKSSVAVWVHNYEETDMVHYVTAYAAQNPDLVMEIPAVEAFVYPDSGNERIIELVFTYRNDRDVLLQMNEKTSYVFTAAELYARSAGQVREKYAQLYAFLMERTDYTYEKSDTPAYSLLIEGKGDCYAFADIYAAMCRRAGLECHVVEGIRDGEPWTWNVIKFRGSEYHLDLLRCNEGGGFDPKIGSAMEGYSWDRSALKD